MNIRVKAYEASNEIGVIIKELMDKRNYLMSQGLDNAALTRVNSIDMLHLAMDLIAYADVLNDRYTLEYEGFLIPKLDRVQVVIENCKTRIKQSQK